MTKNELIATLRLQCVPNIGDITAKKLIAHCGSPTAIFSDKVNALRKIEGVGEAALKGLFEKKHLEAAEREFQYIVDNKIVYTYFQDQDYPSYLKHCVDGPLLLFQRGNIDISNKRIISVVGTRNITSYGVEFCEKFIEDIAPLDPIIISGFAYGVDICIQRAAARHGLQTIGCLAHGLNQIYPKRHAVYMDEIEKHGGFYTEFWSNSHPERENFLKRNRIIAGLGEATIVVESAEKGGSLVTADIANSYNREVFAVPGRVNDAYSLGCNNLIRQQKAHMISCAADLVYLMGWEIEEEHPKSIQKQLFVELDDIEKTIYGYLQDKGKQQLDSIALECSLPVFRTSSTLLNMEMKGIIRPMPGKLFEAI